MLQSTINYLGAQILGISWQVWSRCILQSDIARYKAIFNWIASCPAMSGFPLPSGLGSNVWDSL
ncbi:hypothetical protein [Flavobacterium luteum]|uniref:Uncharacterized protein n=1 Tax=Flavobacterium luteum TaxID=2026654 RepID=A0A7J5ADL7_9FLAO|nr:hypothetical protein [Flavobacterium luteum]KAB1155681.1 hypothetical protein F6464_09150 [Flavobacterium luteum]